MGEAITLTATQLHHSHAPFRDLPYPLHLPQAKPNKRQAKIKMLLFSFLPPLVVLGAAGILPLQHTPALTAAVNSIDNGAPVHARIVPVGRTRSTITHPSTGSCVLRTNLQSPLTVGPCELSDSWEYTPQKFLVVKGTYFCLQAVAPGQPAKLGVICSDADSAWDMEKLQGQQVRISKESSGVGKMCLEVGVDGRLMTSPCLRDSDGQVFEYTKVKRDSIKKTSL